MGIAPADRTTLKWRGFGASQVVGVQPNPRVARDARFFVMGSCFAEEIRKVLAEVLGAGAVLPLVGAEDDGLKESHLNTFNPLSVVQEMERVLGLWAPAADDVWAVNDQVQCPYRRLVFAEDAPALAKLNTRLDAAMKQGFSEADHFIFTYGLIEVFLTHTAKRAANQRPGYMRGGGKSETTFKRLTMAECRDAMVRVARLIRAEKPEARIFMTVSPVPMKRTFSGEDIIVANMQSKATLRAAVAEAAVEEPAITYFPSFEAVMSEPSRGFLPDGRHVNPEVVGEITKTFVATQIAPAGDA